MFDSWHRQFVKLVFLAFPQWRVLRAYRWLKKLRIVCHGRWRRGDAGYPLSLQVEPSIMSLEMYTYLWPAQRAGWEIPIAVRDISDFFSFVTPVVCIDEYKYPEAPLWVNRMFFC
jgi:hypothetical protein